MSNFSEADADALFAAIRSKAKALGIFSATIGHDPENAPPSGLSCSIALGPVDPVTESGLAAVSGQVTLSVHVWSFAQAKPLDEVDPKVLWGACALMGAFAGGFTLGGTVREISLFKMGAKPGYVNFQGKEFRTMTITLPIVINDMFAEVSLCQSNRDCSRNFWSAATTFPVTCSRWSR